jgi:four helix bundle protein
MPQTDLLDRTFEFACHAVTLYQQLIKRGGAGRALAKQFLDAATSVAANEEEAQAAASRADFLSKQTIVLRESRESHLWLRIFERASLGDADFVRSMRVEAGELVAILTTIVKKTRENDNRSSR